MKKEQIEKAAREQLKGIVPCEWNQQPFIDIFVDAANWRINSVWHDANEEPKHGEHILVRFKSGNFTSWFVSTDICSVFKRFEVVAWAYIEDLLPNKEG
jgi:hypothetical protein